MIKVSKNIPIPKRESPKKGKSKYPFADMEVEHSFPVAEKNRYSVQTLAKKYGDSCTPVKTFTVRKNSEGKLRCWRIS